MYCSNHEQSLSPHGQSASLCRNSKRRETELRSQEGERHACSGMRWYVAWCRARLARGELAKGIIVSMDGGGWGRWQENLQLPVGLFPELKKVHSFKCM